MDFNLENFTNKIKEKIGEENFGKISDDIAELMLYDNANEKLKEENSKEIEKLKHDKEVLLESNASLLLKVPMSKKSIEEETEDKEKEKYSFRELFDEKGNFIK